MSIDVADPKSREGVPLYEMQHLLIRSKIRLGQVLKRRQNHLTLLQIAKR